MLKFGYAHITSYHTGKDSYSKRLYRDHYPRYHVYLKEVGDKLTFSLHIDQKQTSYQGSHAHAGEYDGPLVEQEINNLKSHIVAIIRGAEVATSTRQEEAEANTKSAWWKFW